MKILVIGRTGQIGAELCQLLAREHVPYIAPGRAELDITQSAMIQAALALHKPSIVINTAGYRSPSKAESEPSRCFALNRDAVAHLAKACTKHHAVLLQISSWRVFNGKSRTPYTEENTPMPLSVLDNSFWQGEQQVIKHCPQHIILRLSWVVSFRSRNRLTIYLDCMRRHKTLPAHAEHYGNPTTAWDVARVILGICRQIDCHIDTWGIYHYGAEGIVSETFLAETVRAEASRAGSTHNWKAIYPHNTPDRPKRYSCLDSTLLRDTFGIHRRLWRESLSQLVQTSINHLDARLKYHDGLTEPSDTTL